MATQTADKTGFKPKAIVKKLMVALPERSRVVLESRFGLGTSSERVTLEAIGKRYGITRERVRQIENHALAALKKSPAFASAEAAFQELERIIDGLGGIVCEVNRCWFVDHELAAKVESALKSLYSGLSDEDLIPEGEMIDRFLKELQSINDKHRNSEVLRRWLSISKSIGKNP